jgi:sugar phosphate isomerase/epimerase
MEIGIFPTTFIRPTLAEALDAMAEAGIRCAQFSLKGDGRSDLPASLTEEDARRIAAEFAERGIEASAVSGTFNMAHPDEPERKEGLHRLQLLAGVCKTLNTSVITLCTGTRNRESMWRPHPENGSPEAWRDLLRTMEAAVEIAEGTGVTLAIEPEVSNVVDSAPKARRLLDEMGSGRLNVCFDGANLYPAGALPRQREIMDEAFDLLGPDIALAHAKDLDRDGEAGHLAAGTGLLDYDHYLRGLRHAGYDGPIILHSLTEAQAPECVAFLREKIAQTAFPAERTQ